MKKIKTEKGFDFIVTIILTLFSFITLVPLLYIVVNSISNPELVYQGEIFLIPKGITWEAYERVFMDDEIIRGYANTIFYTLLGTVLSMVLTFTAAYPLSLKDLVGSRFLTLLFTITMFVNGGLIPTYLVVEKLHMTNTIWGFIIPGCLSVWNVIVVKTYMQSTIPLEIQEAAMIDGSSDMKLFLRIIIPLCKPIIAVMVLFYAVGYWNSYFNALIYITDESLYPLQMVLRKILISADMSNMMSSAGGAMESIAQQSMLSESLKYATIVLASAPILFLYPFAQKYFEKGVMIGSVKG